MSSDVFIVGAARTPVGSLQGTLASQTAPQLGAHAIAAALSHADINASDVDEVVMGNVVSAGLKQAPARQAMRQAKLPDSCGATTINKVCGSGMKAAMIATDLIRAGSADTVVAGGMESMSNAPYLLDKARSGLRMGHTQMLDALFTDGLEDAETGGSMGSFAQNTADQHQLTREAMDAYAIESVTRARNAIENRSLASEIAPMEINGTLVEDDEQPGRAKIDRIPSLRPAFKADGTITAANSSSISDGASALVLASADALGDREPLAKVVGHATHSIHPSEFTLAPIGAIQKLADKIGWDLDSVDLFEINEAFAMVTMLTVQELGLDTKRVNVFGGACAQGHPIGSTGSRLIVTLAHAMKNQGKQRGIAALCIGGGEATAIALER
ncbi:MAG: thiolase family protein [Pseudomonadota bacterium]|nr:thiolase family protein [Pseudomonadota bacterium]MEC7781046.1 thiolase family protein [Pseudomonadota bacterium]